MHAVEADPLELLKLAKVASMAGVGRRRVLSAVDSGELRGLDITDPATHSHPKHKPHWRFSRADVADWIARMRTGRSGPATPMGKRGRRVPVVTRHFRG